MRTAWACLRAARWPWPANATWPSSPSWARSVRTFGRSAISVSRHLEAFKDVFVHVVPLAGVAGLVKLGNVSTDGTKIQGNASRHKAMSYGYMRKAVERLREEIEALVTQAYQQD